MYLHDVEDVELQRVVPQRKGFVFIRRLLKYACVHRHQLKLKYLKHNDHT